MTTVTLGVAVQSQSAVTAAADLDKLTVSAEKAEKGTSNVGRASREMSAALGSITAILTNIERHTGTLASGMNRASAEVLHLGSSAGVASANLKSMETVSASVTMDMRGLSTGATVVTSAFQKESVAVGSATAALRQNTQAANENRAAMASRASSPSSGGQSFNTANVAAQFQDIAVTSAMGMSPLQIALQQGTQLSAVLGGQGLTGVVRTLGGAFASILSPVSLLTIAAVALGAVGLQSLGSLFKGAESASDALERHNEFLEKTLAGYESVRDAATSALDAALKLPEASVTSDLGQQRDDAAKAGVAAMERVLQLRKEFEGYAGYAEAFNVPADVVASLESASEVISRLTADSSLSRQELDQLHTTLTELGNNTADTNIKAIVAEALALVNAARQATGEVASLDAALSSIPRDIQIRISMNSSFGSAMDAINGLYKDPRSSFDQARAELKSNTEWATNTATSYGQVVAAAENYERVLGSIDAAEAESKKKSGAGAAKSAAKPFNQWESATESFQQRVDQQRMEIDLLGASTFEIARQQAAFDLLNQAKQAGIPITSTVTEQINSLATEAASATSDLERMTQAANDNAAIWGQAEQGVSSIIKTWARGGDVLDVVQDKLWGIFDMLVDMAVRDLFANAFKGGDGATAAIGGNQGGGVLGSLLGTVGKLFGFASGTADTGGMPGQPRGIVHGREAVIPLPNGGKVPVQLDGQTGNVVNMAFNQNFGVTGSVSEADIQAMNRQAAQAAVQMAVDHVKQQLPGWQTNLQIHGAA